MDKMNYNKLNGRIKEYFKTQVEFGQYLKLSPTSINNKLTCKVPFTQEEIYDSIIGLHIKPSEIKEIFFTKEVE